jgi:hypothetical protein
MSGKSMLLSTAIACGLAFALPAMTPANAAPNVLPGVKGYNFNASPAKMRRLCRNRWGGRYWHAGRYYGCDDIVYKGNRFEIRCLVPKAHSRYENPCIIKRGEPPSFGNGPLDHRPSPGANGQQGSSRP